MKTACSFLCSIFFAISLSSQNSPEEVVKDFLEKSIHPYSGLSTTHPIQNNIRELSWRSPGDRLDSLYQWSWNVSAGEWQLQSRTYYTTDDEGNFLGLVFWSWDGTQWNQVSRQTFTYDINNNLVHELTETWNGTDWQNDEQTIYTFDSNQDLIHRLAQTWNGLGWDNFFQFTYTYDSNHNILTLHTQLWLGSEWAPGTLHTFTYDDDNKLILRLVQSWNGEWVNNIQILPTYDGEGNLAIELHQDWVNDHWEDGYRNLYAYDANLNRTLILIQIAVDSMWVDDSRFIYTYDGFNNITNLTFHQFVNDMWTLVDQFLVAYDENQNRISEVYQIWENGWLNQDSSHFYYTLSTGISGTLPVEILSIYPNPASNTLQINSGDMPFENLNVEIYSSSGKNVLNSVVNGTSGEINISHLATGTYHVLIHNGNRIYRAGFIKI